MIYIACEDMDFIWREQDMEKVERLWLEGYNICFIARAVRREVDEVAILIMDRSRQGFLSPRPTGVFGKMEDEDES